MAVKEALIKLVDGLECRSRKIQNALNSASVLLKEDSTKIPDNQTGKQQIYQFLFLLFTNYPTTMTKANYEKLETFVSKLEKNLAPRTGKSRGR